MTFKELAILRKRQLSKQPPVTLEEARAQVLWLTIISSSRTKKSKIEKINHLLKMYYPDWTKEQIESEQKKLLKLATTDIKKKQQIVRRLNKHKKEGH